MLTVLVRLVMLLDLGSSCVCTSFTLLLDFRLSCWTITFFFVFYGNANTWSTLIKYFIHCHLSIKPWEILEIISCNIHKPALYKAFQDISASILMLTLNKFDMSDHHHSSIHTGVLHMIFLLLSNIQLNMSTYRNKHMIVWVWWCGLGPCIYDTEVKFWQY